MVTHPALARLALPVHEQVLGGVELEAQEVLVAAQEGQVLLHLRHLGRSQPIAAARGGGEAAHLGDDGGRRTRGGGMVASAVSPPGAPPPTGRTWRGWCAIHAASTGYHTVGLVRTRRPATCPVPLAPPVGICDGWLVGEVPERPKGHAWRACVPTRYRGFESLPLRLKNSSGRPSAARVRFAQAAHRTSARLRRAPRRRRLAWHL